ncbi:hypothetical protein NIES4074_41190 [Cylindrospermum sp. NIES-4074]|nr:hypothetical protein NIES4074_41190 [Cylindrospermum sp. NIES-4074]
MLRINLHLLQLLLFTSQKKPQSVLTNQGSLVIRVHLLIKCSQSNYHAPDQFAPVAAVAVY